MTWGVYAHVPWCRVRCPYCAFDILPRVRPEDEVWAAGVANDLQRWRGDFPGTPRSLYIGGGTPSRLRAKTLAGLVREVGAEDVTVEANPEDLSDAWLQEVVDGGVTRVSLGVQSSISRFARQLGRAHVPPFEAVRRLQMSTLESWSVDLIFGLPGQTLDDLRADLDTLLSWEPPHVSLYGLTIEPDTAFHALEQRGRTMQVDEDLWSDMYQLLVDRLDANGLHRYEVSNFARTGHESRHNALYWEGRPYLGVGPSAHGFAPDGRRWMNPSFGAWRAGVGPAIDTPTPEQAALDELVSGLRGVGGIEDSRLGLYRVNPRVRRELQENGLLVSHPTRLVLTPSGFPVIDAVVRTLANALHGPIG